MHAWGLTGGIASGKSTVARMFVARGVPVVDADALYHGLLAPANGQPSALAARIAATFAPLTLLGSDGRLDRGALGRLVFADPQARTALEELTHPAVRAAAAAAMQDHAASGAHHVLHDVPLLFERSLQASYEGVVLVWVRAEVQLARLQARDRMDETTAHLRLAAQMALDAKRPLARWVIDNGGDLPATEAQVDGVWQAMQAA